MIEEILSKSSGELFKMGLSAVGITCMILHILPKSGKKSGFFAFLENILKFVKMKR
jgi:hypothetical protein